MRVKLCVGFSVFCLSACTLLGQGSLTPPGAPAATMKTLQQVEPRTPISSLPFTINSPGSYYVTTNLTSASGGISINTDDVVIDLNGFSLTGGTAIGISVTPTRKSIVVRNGILRNWGWGIDASGARSSTFEHLKFTENVTGGMVVGSHCQVIACVANANTNAGIVTGAHCTISDCDASDNTSEGIRTGSYCQVIGSRAAGNTNAGILTGGYAIVSRCHAGANGGSGINTGLGSRIAECTSVQNRGHGISMTGGNSTVQDSLVKDNVLSGIFSTSGGYTVRNCKVENNLQHGIDVGACCNIISGCNVIQNGRDGINVVNRSHISGDLIHLNSLATNNSAGIRLSADQNRVEDNTVASTDVGVLALGAGNFIIRNHAYNNGTNYHFAVSQNAGPIVGTGTITTNNPWANFSY